MRTLRIIAISIGSLLGLLVLLFVTLQIPPGQRLAAGLVTWLAPDVEIAGLRGFFPTDMRVAEVTLRDRDGPWLSVSNARLRWSFASLLGGRLLVEEMAAESVAVLRPPVPDSDKNGGGLSLPVGVDIQALSIGDLHLGAALTQVDSHWKLSGRALLPADLALGQLVLNGDRLDGPTGKLVAEVRFDAGRRTVDGSVTLSEGHGGVVAVLLERPDIENLTMRLAAKGDANAGKVELTVSAADAARATGTATWEPRDGSTAVAVRLETAAPGLPQGRVADAVRAPTVLTAEAVVGDKVVTLSEVRFTGGPLVLDGNARYDRASDRLEGTLNARADEPGAFGPLTGGVAWRGLHLEAKADLARLSSRPQGTIAITGAADDLSLMALDARIPAIGAVTLATTLAIADGRITARPFELASPLASLTGEASYVPATETGEAKVTLALPSLEPLSALAGTPLGGNATIDLTASTDRGGVKLGWSGSVRDIAAEGLPADIATAPVALSGAATWRRDETWTVSDVKVASAGGTLGLSGRGRDSTGDLDLSLDLPQLAVLRPDLGGSATLSAAIKLGKERTDLRLSAKVSGLQHGQATSRQLTVDASGSLDADGAARAELKVGGDLASRPLSLDGRVAVDAAGGVVVPAFQGRWASVALDVDDLAVTQGRTSGYARLKIARLADAAALAGTALAGELDAEVTADDRASNGRVTVRVTGTDLRVNTLSVGALDFRSTIDEPMKEAASNSTLTATRIAGAADINRLNATATGDRQAQTISLQATGAQTAANLTARVELAAGDIVVGLSKFDGRYTGIPVALAGPTRFHIAGSRIAIEPTNLRVGAGRLSVRGTLAPTGSDMQVEAAGFPLAMIDTFAPGTNLDGTLQAKARIQGGTDAPLIDGTYSVAGLRLRQPQAALVPPLTVQGSGSLMGRQASIDARLGAGGATSLTLKGKATLPRGAAPTAGSAAISGTIDLAPFAPLLGNDVRNITGRLRPDLTLEIAGQRVTGNGTIDFSGGAVALPESGLRLSGGEGRLSLQGDTLQIQRLSFQATRGGTVTASGTLRLDAQQGIMPDVTVATRNALLVSRPDLVASVTSNLKVTGSTVGGIEISGPITVDRADIAVGAQQTAAFPTLEVREVNKPGEATPNPTAQANPPRKPPPPGGSPIRLKLVINAPQAVFVRGRGLDAEMSGKLDVAGSPFTPTVTGGLTLRRGDFNLLGRRLNFSRGVVTLDNLDRVDPRLDFVASTTVQSTTINVTIAGTSRAPLITVDSVPSLPPDEAMALLLFGKPASGLSVFELAQAAQGLAELTGNPSGSGALTRLRTGLGLDRLSVNSGSNASSPVSLEAGRYVAPGVYVGARQGASGNSSRGVVQVDVLEHVKIEGDVGADSNGRVGVKLQWDY